MSFMKKKLTLTEALDFLEQLDSETEDAVSKIFIEPPDNDGYISGEDDAPEDEAGIPDNVCPAQLKSKCEIVLRSGQRLCSDEDIEENQNNNEDVLNNSGENLSVSLLYRSTIADASSQPTKLNKVTPKSSLCPLPTEVRKNNHTWENNVTVASNPIFPECNYEDCLSLQPHEQFEKFFDEILIKHIVEKSNEYAVFKGKKNPNIYGDEIRTFIGILLITGYNSPARTRDMWSVDNDLRNDLVFESMRRDRFHEICSCLHFVGKDQQISDADKMWKLRPVTDHLKFNMLKNFHPEQNLSYDESMISYFGKHSCKQFIKGKPIRFGYKVWSLCTPTGYLVNFEIYQGKNPRSNERYEQCFGKCAAPLINMIDDFPEEKLNLPYSFYFDNLFTSFQLLHYLKNRGYCSTGTIRENRVPKDCPIGKKNDIKKRQKRGYCNYIMATELQINLTQWLDNSVVLLASTAFGATLFSKIMRYSKEEKKKINIQRPRVVAEYSKNMGGVDRLDQNVNCYRVGYRGKKWWSSIFTWLLDASVQNAWQLHRVEKGNMSQLEFRRQIAIYYCKHSGESRKRSGLATLRKRRYEEDSVENTLRYDGKDHFVMPIVNKRRCAGDLCKTIGRTACKKCDVDLCIKCFADYHTKF